MAVLLGGYSCIAYITHAAEGFYTYGFLDLENHRPGILVGSIIGMGALVIAMFMLSWCLIWLRLWVTEVHKGRPGKFSRDTARIGTSSTASAGAFIEKDGVTQERIEMVDKNYTQTRV